MIYITGDTHGEYNRFSTDAFPEQKTMTKADYAIVCGDFGIWKNDKTQNYWFDWLNNKPFTTLFVDGNHENYDWLYTFPVEEWNGGKVHIIRPTVLHLMRGQLFELDGKRIFTMGGASSHDISNGILEPDALDYKKKRAQFNKQGKYMYRINHVSWWREELPSEVEYNVARQTLERCGWNVDWIITHCAPNSIADILGGGLYQHDALTTFLEEVSQRCKFKHWFFGHYHDNRVVMTRYIGLYEQIVELPE